MWFFALQECNICTQGDDFCSCAFGFTELKCLEDVDLCLPNSCPASGIDSIMHFICVFDCLFFPLRIKIQTSHCTMLIFLQFNLLEQSKELFLSFLNRLFFVSNLDVARHVDRSWTQRLCQLHQLGFLCYLPRHLQWPSVKPCKFLVIMQA